MPRVPQIKARELVKVLLKIGFKKRGQVGSHAVYTHIDGRKTTVPMHPGRNIGIGLLGKIIKRDVKISKEDLVKLLKK